LIGEVRTQRRLAAKSLRYATELTCHGKGFGGRV
jgi:hypothetical protein